jgi:hypothetical protein
MVRETTVLKETLFGSIQNYDDAHFFAAWVPNKIDLNTDQEIVWFDFEVKHSTNHHTAKEEAMEELRKDPDFETLEKTGVFKIYFYKHDVDTEWPWPEIPV